MISREYLSLCLIDIAIQRHIADSANLKLDVLSSFTKVGRSDLRHFL